jgi:hypothetical protein
VAATDLSTGVAALVVVSAADDWPNAGFAARVAEHMHYTLLPLLSAARAAGVRVIHIPNGHRIAGAAQPAAAEFVVHTASEFERIRTEYSLKELVYLLRPIF